MRFARPRPAEVATVTAAPRYAVKDRPDRAGRCDLTCAVCLREIAYGIRAERVAEDAAFYLEQHRPFCMAVG